MFCMFFRCDDSLWSFFVAASLAKLKNMICILYGFPCKMDFSHHGSRRGWDSEKSGEKSVSHGKPYKMHFLAYFARQSMVIMLNTMCKLKVEDHENISWIYRTTVLYMGECQMYARIHIPVQRLTPNYTNG